MTREQLFKSFGFQRVGGIVDGQFDSFDDTYDVDAFIYVDFKRKRVMIDSGDGSEPIFLKGKALKREEKEIQNYEDKLTDDLERSFEKS